MKILMLSWEYPPKSVGGLSNHVYNLSKALCKMGHEIHVITCEEGTAPVEENDNGVYVHRVAPYKLETEDFIKWVMQLNFAMIEEGTRLIRKIGRFDFIHAHDWLAAFSAKVLKWSFNIPMVSTIHATEHGRNNGIRTEMQRYISSAEWMLSYESWKIVVCSNYMRQQITDIFKAPWDKIWVIPNGVNTIDLKTAPELKEFRLQYALEHEKLIFFIGRHVFEKGIHLLVDSIPELITNYPNTKFVIAGVGPMTEDLKKRVSEMGMDNNVIFTRYMEDATRNMMYQVADAAVFPSLYEPFGIVALEAMSAGCPVVVSDTGGLSEIIKHKQNGMKFIAGSVENLSFNIMELLKDEELASSLKTSGCNTIKGQYNWDYTAALTVQMYEQITEEAEGTDWEISEKISSRNTDSLTKTVEEELVTVAISIDTEDKSKISKKGGRSRKTKDTKEVAEKETALDLEGSEVKKEVKTRRRKSSTTKTES